MADLSKLIAEKEKSAKFMVDGITHICKDMPKRDPGSEGEKMACEYMGQVLRDECGCETTFMEEFKENPGSFFGWIYFCVGLGLAACVLNFFMPVISIVLAGLSIALMVAQFGFYKKIVDKFFPEKTGHNMTAIKKCKGEVKARIFLNGHPDACWLWPVNEKYGGVVHCSQYAFGAVGLLYVFAVSIINTIITKAHPVIVNPTDFPVSFWLGIAQIFFVPWFIALCFMWNEKIIVDGANDNLTGCYMGIALLKAMKENGIELEHTEVGVILSGSEEAGLRGAMAWAEAHKNDYNDVPTWILSYDTIHEARFLAANYRDLNATVALDKEVGDAFFDAAKELDIYCEKGIIPPFGGATDAAAFAKAGFKAISIGAMNYKLEKYYHTRFDSWDNLDEGCLADCYAVSVKTVENFDKKYGEGQN